MNPPGGLQAVVGRVGVMLFGGQFRAMALSAVAAGDVVLRVQGRETSVPTRYSLQVGANEHVDVPPGIELREQLESYRWSFLNHSCEPNAAFRGRDLVAIRAIAAREELTFHYATTEWEMAEPFVCGCGSPRCGKVIRGYRDLDRETKERLAPHVASYLQARERIAAEGCGQAAF
jgi:hypothetical protein